MVRVFSLYSSSLLWTSCSVLQPSSLAPWSNLHSVVHGVSTSLCPQLAATHTQHHSHVHTLPAVHRATNTPFPAMHGDTHRLHSLASDSTTKAVLPILSDICLSDSCPLAILILSSSDPSLLSTPCSLAAFAP